MDGRYYSYRYNAWFDSIVSQAKLLCEHEGLFPAMYYDFLYRDDERTAIAFADCPEGFGSCFEDAVRLIKSMGRAKRACLSAVLARLHSQLRGRCDLHRRHRVQ